MSEEIRKTDFLFSANAVFIEELHQKFLNNPLSVEKVWRDYFNQHQEPSSPLETKAKIIDKFHNEKWEDKSLLQSKSTSLLNTKFIINAYRARGHFLTNLDPLYLEKNKGSKELKLTLEDFNIRTDELDKIITCEFADKSKWIIKDLISELEGIYCSNIGVEFSHIENDEEREWLHSNFENNQLNLTQDEKKILLGNLIKIESFEQYLHTKFPGAKRFSIEGGEGAIICIDKIIEFCSMDKVIIGMAHRGRLSTLTKILNKPYHSVIAEFMGKVVGNPDISGDVKYHMGFESKRKLDNNEIKLSLLPNPSHLEAINPVVMGKVRMLQDKGIKNTMGILIHGDAAFCGQGVVFESLMMSVLDGYNSNGTIHIVINNQIGFTANTNESRSTRYCTDVAKAANIPIIHVNSDDAESIVRATKLATDYRNKFKKDFVIDIVCYRKYGHNEGDEPLYTQSLMYKAIKNKKSPSQIYGNNIKISEENYSQIKNDFKIFLDKEFKKAQNYINPPIALQSHTNEILKTGIDKKELKNLGEAIYSIPDNFDVNSKLKKLLSNRINLINNGSIDWSIAEQLAYATLLNEGVDVRITGQDARRGTFSHRHAVLHSQSSNRTYIPLDNISSQQGKFTIVNSNLSEYGVLGFEYGYSLSDSKQLIIWEAQFGDFANGAQIVFDQFISSGETKWQSNSNLVCLLPHGYEGQGPEHSSARLERFMQLCAKDNIQIAQVTKSSSIFHLLRRQAFSKIKKPLIIMSPKSLLRHKLVTSDLSEFDINTSFTPVIDEIDKDIKANVRRIILCSGKVYYDLLEYRRKQKIKDVVIIRLEQLYPLDKGKILDIIRNYNSTKEYIWCQEEPKNMGAWSYIMQEMDELRMSFVGRDASSSPASGYLNIHKEEQDKLLMKAFR